MSTQNPTHGTKVSNVNGAPNIYENSGPVASDSLAAESTRAGGDFSENRGSEPQGVAGQKSTFANKNTSGAVTLDPARDAEARLNQSGGANRSYPDGVGGQSKDSAVEYTGGTASSDPSSANGATAPTYISSQYLNGGKPKGKNLTEGGFDSDGKHNASFNTDTTSKDDPARLATAKILRSNADAGGDAAIERQGNVNGAGTYGALGGDTEA